MVPVNRIYNIVKLNSNDPLTVYDKKCSFITWTMFLERAPEIGQANAILSYWLFLYEIANNKNENECLINTIGIPEGKLDIGCLLYTSFIMKTDDFLTKHRTEISEKTENDRF